MKKHSFRTMDPEKIKTKAQKIRSMPDDELVHYIEDRINKKESEVINQAQKELEDFIESLGKIRGIGRETMAKIRRQATRIEEES